MSSTSAPTKPGLLSFRIKLLVAMMLVVSGITALGLYLAERQLAANAERELEREFQGEVDSLHRVQELHRAALAERCRVLAEKPRIHAALEDNALDLLYPNAKDELRDLMEWKNEGVDPSGALHATFYRFLDSRGSVIMPPNAQDLGELSPEEEPQLSLKTAPAEQQIGYLFRRADDGRETIDEMIAMPIISSETDQPIAAIVVGVKPVEFGRQRGFGSIKSGIWLKGRLHLFSPQDDSSRAMMLGRELSRAIAPLDRSERSLRVEVNSVPHLLFYKLLNPNSLFPPAYEICIYPLSDLLARQRQLRWQIIGAGGLLLLVAFSISHFASARLSGPVTQLAEDSAANRAEWERAQAALEKTSQELQRSARFSADTSHQLKTPVTVLRAGLEGLRAHENLTPEGREEIAALIHQTYRITSIIEDLLLLSQMDAGRLQISFTPINLSGLLDAQVDDLSALPDSLDVEVESDCPDVKIAGEKPYVALILQNLLENARKYNRPGGRIRISCREEGEWVILIIGNSGRSISGPAREHIFERFHRGTAGGDIPGHGLGLNLARELARLHGGDLRLVSSGEDWTEFEVRFRLASQPAGATPQVS